MSSFLLHLFDRTGFPVSRMTFGHGWDKTLLFLSVTGEALSTFSYLLFIIVLFLFALRWHQGRIDRFRADRHISRVVIAFLITTTLSGLVHAVNLYCYWVPTYRFAGLCLFLAGLGLFAAALKTLWAFTLCVLPGQKDKA